MSRLSQAQKRTIWFGIVAVAGLCVYVPWTEGVHNYARGYSFIFWPPNTYSHVDTTRALIPAGLVVLLTAGLVHIGPTWKLRLSKGCLHWLFDQETHRGRFMSAIGFLACPTLAVCALSVVCKPLEVNSSNTLSGPDQKIYVTPTGRSVPLSQWIDEELDQAIRELSTPPHQAAVYSGPPPLWRPQE